MAKVNDEGKEYIADVSSGLRLTADIPNGELGYVLMAQLVTRYGITELLGITESDLNTQTRVGVYKYSIMQPGATKTDYGLLFVYASDVPTSGSGDYPLYQTRFQDGKMQTRSRTMPSGLWTDWEDVGGSPDAVLKNASNQVGDTFSLTSQNDNGDITVSAGRNGEAKLTGGKVRVDSGNGATEIDGMGVNITSTGAASVTAYIVSLNATNGNAEVEGSRGVNISSTNGDINLNPGTSGKVKVGGKEVATKEDALETLIIQANACGATYNEETGFFELNGLTNITEQQMGNIIVNTPFLYGTNNFGEAFAQAKIRTNCFKQGTLNFVGNDAINAYWFAANSDLEILNLYNYARKEAELKLVNCRNMFGGCRNLKKVIGILDVNGIDNINNISTIFGQCAVLEDVKVKGVNIDISVEDSPKLSKDSILYMIENSVKKNTDTFVITLHPDAYAMAIADSDITEALSTHSYVSLASA